VKVFVCEVDFVSNEASFSTLWLAESILLDVITVNESSKVSLFLLLPAATVAVIGIIIGVNKYDSIGANINGNVASNRPPGPIPPA
jgi:hypothetical protein